MKLPKELLEELSTFTGMKKRTPKSNLILDTIKRLKKATVDEVLIEVYKHNKILLKRNAVYQNVHRLKRKGLIKSDGKKWEVVK